MSIDKIVSKIEHLESFVHTNFGNNFKNYKHKIDRLTRNIIDLKQSDSELDIFKPLNLFIPEK